MEHNITSINELPFDILMEIFEYFTIPEIARFPMTCTHWRDLMQQDHFWASLARKTYGQYVGETPSKRELEELSKRCGQELTFMHWLQYRSLFGLTMNMAVHVGASVADDVFDYKVALEPGLNTKTYETNILLSFGSYIPTDKGVSTAMHWNATFFLVITPESGDQIRKEVPLISFADLSGHYQTRHRGKVYKYKIKISKLMKIEALRMGTGSAYSSSQSNTVKQVMRPVVHLYYGDINAVEARVGFNSQNFKAVYRYNNPFIYPPTLMLSSGYSSDVANFIYQNLTVHEFIPILAKNFNDTIQSQMQLYLAEIVCGFEVLHSNNIYLKDCIPVIKKDGHLQFICAGPRYANSSFFGLSPLGTYSNHTSLPPFQADCYALGIFLLEVCTGNVLLKQHDRVAVVQVPHGLSIELTNLLSTLLAKDVLERPKNILAVKKSAYFKGIDWQRMRRQDWSPKFLPNLE